MRSIGTILEQKRKERGLLQAELAALLADEGILVSKHAVSKWESDRTLPNAQQFLALCRVLKIYDVLGEFLGEADELRTGLNAQGKARLREYARLLRGDAAFREAEKTVAPRVLPLYDLAVSAGTGTDASDSDDTTKAVTKLSTKASPKADWFKRRRT